MSFKETYVVVNSDNESVVFQGSLKECMDKVAELEKKYVNRFFHVQETLTL